jgi:acyl-CoA reductase-like NAD-dependent aldehyde dehydrogenase
MFQTVNPVTQSHLRTFPYLSSTGVSQKLTLADDAFSLWSGLEVRQRSACLREIASRLEDGKEAFAMQVTTTITSRNDS